MELEESTCLTSEKCPFTLLQQLLSFVLSFCTYQEAITNWLALVLEPHSEQYWPEDLKDL